MLKFYTLDGILSSFTKVQNRLETFAAKQETKAESLFNVRMNIKQQEEEARLNAETARRVSTNIVNLLSA